MKVWSWLEHLAVDCGEVIMRGLEVQVVTHPALPCLVLQTEGEELMVEREGREGRRVVNLV